MRGEGGGRGVLSLSGGKTFNQERAGQVRDSQSAKSPGLSFELKW